MSVAIPKELIPKLSDKLRAELEKSGTLQMFKSGDVILKENARKLAYEKGFEKEFKTLENVELLTPEVFSEIKGVEKTMCANVDLYSGLVYKVLGIPEDLYTPIFAVARTAGWCAHRLEELTSGGKIIRPAYKSVSKPREFKPIIER